MRNTPALAAVGFALLGTSVASAESAAPDIYQPRTAAQTPPLRVEVIDGVRFRDIETHTIFRLFGVEACAPQQTAKFGRQPWPCGTMATAWLVKATLNAWVACVTIREEGDERLARCSTAHYPDLGAAMLEEGVAVLAPATPAESPVAAYAAAEARARKAFRGLWASAFEMPWEWRARHPAAAPVGPQGQTRP
jgi:endonuclease YncB( thermonuclease family)